MAVELNVNGFFEVNFYEIDEFGMGEEVSEETEKIILENLKNGSYLFSMNNKTVVSLDDLQTVLYGVSLDATDALNYEWDNI